MTQGIDATQKAVVAIAVLANSIGKVLEDGKVGITDLVHVYAPIAAINTALKDFKQIPAQIRDLDTAELAQLRETFIREFDLPQDGIEAVVEQAVDVTARLIEIVLTLKKNKAA